jgi:hypothetical protein
MLAVGQKFGKLVWKKTDQSHDARTSSISGSMSRSCPCKPGLDGDNFGRRGFVEIGCHNPRFSIRSARSMRRLEKPHSLSYHARILTSLPPMTKVESPSTMDERGSPR